MLLLHRRDCHFAKDGGCELSRWRVTCWTCGMYIRNMRDRSPQEHIALAVAKGSDRRASISLILSFLAMAASVLSMIISLLTYWARAK